MHETLPLSEITGGHRLPLDLCRRHEAFLVSAGHADIFAIKRGGNGQDGRKHHLFRVEQGTVLLGFPPLPGEDLRLIAVGGLETRFLAAAIQDLAPAAIRSWTERLDQTAWPPAENTPPPAEPEEIHRRTLRAIAERLALRADQEQDLIERRARRNRSLTARLLSVLTSIAAAQISVTHPTAPGGPIAALLPLARRLGLDEILSRHRRGSDAPSDDIEGIERQLGRLRLRRRRVQLRPGWEGRTDEPLVGWLDDRGPVSLLPGKPWQATSDEASAPLTDALRERIDGAGLQLYRRLPDRKTGFGDLLALAADVSRADLARILLGGAGTALIGFFLPVATALLFDEVVPNGERGALGSITLGLVAAALGSAVFQAWRGIALVRLETRIEGITQSALVDRLLGMPARFFRRFSVGDLTDRLLGVQEARRILGDNALSGLLSLIFSLASLGIMAVFSARLALVALALVLLTAIVDIGLSYGQLRHERRRMRSQGQLDGFLLQLIVGIGKLRVAAAESRAAAQWAARFARQRNHYRAARRWTAAQETVQTVIPGVAQIILYGAMMATLQNDGGGSAPITTGAFIAVTAAFGQLMAAFGAAVRALTRTISAVPLIERARPILESEPDRSIQTEAPDDLTGRIDLRQISFRYAPDLPLVLDGLNLGIKAGEFVALVGGSGSGKSTLLRLLLGFERPDQGEIYFDDRPAGRLDPVALNRLCGVVLQNGGLSSGSILENIVGPAPVEMQRAWEAAAMAGLDQDIKDMPMGMHTMLTDGGAALSGGQRQRLLIARALVHRPRFLFFDEATSALDNRTQAVVTDTLARLTVTRIVIAHRLTTIRNVDRIFVLERGRVAQSGTYEELMAQDGPFVQLARRQLI